MPASSKPPWYAQSFEYFVMRTTGSSSSSLGLLWPVTTKFAVDPEKKPPHRTLAAPVGRYVDASTVRDATTFRSAS